MPHLSLPISAGGPIVEFFVGVSVPRANALRATGAPVPNPVLVRGLIDTGASCTSVDPSILNSLNLSPTGTIPVHTPSTVSGQPHLANQFDISVIFHHPKLTWQFHAIAVIQSELAHQGYQALIGRDILANCLFTYDGQGQFFCLSF
jgi:hypothetical protein